MSIRLSEKYGVNPSITMCFWCGEDTGVALLGRLKGDKKAPHKCVADYEPCNSCKENRAQGITFISIGQDERPTGAWIVLTEDAVLRMVSPGPLLDQILKTRVAGMVEQEFNSLFEAQHG